MNVEPDTYIALGYLGATVAVALVLFGFLLVKRYRGGNR